MHVKRVNILNFGPFEEFATDLQRGSVGIIGRNGRGKSTLLNAIYATLTNDFGRFYGVKVDCVRNTAERGAESFTECVVEHNGKEFTIRRGLKNPSRTTLTVGETVITDSRKVEAEIGELLGVDGDLLKHYVFKEQHTIYDFLTTTPANRAKALAILCRTQQCEELWGMLGDFLNKDAEMKAEIVDNSDELTQRLAQAESQIEELKNTVRTESELLLNSKSKESAEDIVAKERQREYSAKQLKAEVSRLKSLETSFETAKGQSFEATAKLKKVEKRVEEGREAYENAKVALKGLVQYQAYRKQRLALKQEAEALAAVRLTPPERPPGYKDGAETATRKNLLKAQSELETAVDFLAAFESSGKKLAACPQCGTPVDSKGLGARIEENERIRREHPATIRELRRTLSQFEEYDQALRKYERLKAAHEAKVAANEKAREATKKIEAPEGDEDTLKQTVAEYEEVVARQKARRKAAEECERAYRDAQAERDACMRQVVELRAAVDENTVDPEKLERARKRLDEHTTASNNIARAEGEMKGLKQTIESAKTELKRLRERLKRSRTVRRMGRTIAEARDVLYRDCLPRVVAKANLSKVQHDVNANLAQFGDPFWVEASEDLSFLATKPGEPVQPAARLSTGQRVVLALAFWPAVASLWGEDLGMLALDEPTANLDAENRKFLTDALSTLSARVRGHRQLLMVTHDHDLRGSFDQVIDLGG